MEAAATAEAAPESGTWTAEPGAYGTEPESGGYDAAAFPPEHEAGVPAYDDSQAGMPAYDESQPSRPPPTTA